MILTVSRVDAPKPVVGVGSIIFDGQQRVLLIRRGQAPAQGLWSAPGGKQEPGETLAEACVREVLEETGLMTAVTGIIAVVERRLEGFHYVIIDFLAVALTEREMPLRPGGDVLDARWVGLEELSEYPLVQGLEEIINRAHKACSTGQAAGLLAAAEMATDFIIGLTG